MHHEHIRIWRKSSYSGIDNDCVELASMAAILHVRDSKRPSAPALTFRQGPWRALTSALGAH